MGHILPIYVRDGDVWTSAGVTAGMDLALALVEEDLGAEVALEVARWLVLFLKRPGGQSQFSAGLPRRRPPRASRCASCRRGSPTTSTRTCRSARSRARVPERAALRPRVAGRDRQTPAAYVEELRVERARALLEDGEAVEAVARGCGLRRRRGAAARVPPAVGRGAVGVPRAVRSTAA